MKTSKLIVIAAFCLFAFTVGDSKSEYLVPRAAVLLALDDFNLDGDIDIIVGHHLNSQTEWGGFSFLQNDSFGNFCYTDSLYMYGYQTNLYSVNVLGDEIPEILGRYHDGQQTHLAIIELNNWNFNISYHLMGPNITHFSYSDISGNNSIDIAFISNNDFLWGIIYNDGTGNFSTPEYYDLTFPPIDIACGDLNDDGKDDVVLCGTTTEIYFSTDTGFQQQILTTTLSHDVLISDFDNDGDNDIITHTTFIYPNHRVYMFENLGNNQFNEHDYFQFSPFCSYGQISDFNNDSLPDMVFTGHNDEGLYLLYNEGDFLLGNQKFIPNSGGLQFLRHLACADLDLNGFNDIAYVIYNHDYIPYNLVCLFNDGQGNFVEDPLTKIQTPITKDINLFKIYPNPMKDFIHLEFVIENNNSTNISIFDICGNQVTTIENKIYSPGQHKIIWNGTDKNGKEVNPGTYLIRLKAGSQTITKRVVKIK